jgi:SPASM domain peptide maturase of grasp-with-spasm system
MYYIPFLNISYTQGYTQAIMCDHAKQESEAIPNSFVDFINVCKKNTVEELEALFAESKEVFDSYVAFALEKKLIFLSHSSNDQQIFLNDEVKKFSYPSDISNVIIDVKSFNETRNVSIAEKLSAFSCVDIEIRFFENHSSTKIQEIVSLLSTKNVHAIKLLINASSIPHIREVIALFEENMHVNNIVLFAATHLSEKEIPKDCAINFLHKEEVDEKSCGVVSPYFFSGQSLHYVESQCHNTCLNRKLSIDADGNIKNCPSMQHHYGNIEETEPLAVVKNPDFRKYWYYKKDDIDVCQDCEFRHICTDCRAYTKDPENSYSQPAKCNYNPYISLWQDQKDWVSVEQWRKENPDWEKTAQNNRATYKKENCEINLKEELTYFNNL